MLTSIGILALLCILSYKANQYVLWHIAEAERRWHEGRSHNS